MTKLSQGFALVGTLALVIMFASLGPESVTSQQAQPAGSLRTPWGEPDLQGIWSNPAATPLQRAEEYGTREFLTEEEIAAAERELIDRSQALGRDSRDQAGSEVDVARAYNQHWRGDPSSVRGRRTSKVIDPPDGRIPPLTPEAEQRRATKREFLDALLQGTSGGRPGPVSPRRAEPSPDYNLDRLNRHDGPEDESGRSRCFGYVLPVVLQAGTLGGMMRVVQSPGAVGIYYDIDQGMGFSRSIPTTDHPPLPEHIRLQHGDARGRWEGDMLVVEITNFTEKTNYQGSRENLHIIERYRRLDDNTLSVEITIEDPTTWTRPWTILQELTKNSDETTGVWEGGCHEGNYGVTGMLASTRAAERAFAEGRGPDPATQDNATGGG